MNGLNDGWGMGFVWIIGITILAVIIWVIVKLVNQNKNSKSAK